MNEIRNQLSLQELEYRLLMSRYFSWHKKKSGKIANVGTLHALRFNVVKERFSFEK